MALAALQNISIAFGGHQLLDQASLHIEKGQRICLLGRNGSGKTTLMKILHGQIQPDSGTLHTAPGLRVSYFSQDIPHTLKGSVFEIVAGGLGKRGELLVEYHREEQRLAHSKGADHARFHRLQEEMDSHHVWAALDEIGKLCSKMSLNSEWQYSTLSGGQKRRVLLASALVSEPDLLLLDEPTNHLDIETITWMEEFLLRLRASLLFVTHDRMFLRRLATRIVELDRGKLFDWSCDYDTFLERKQAAIEAQEKEWEKFDKKLAEEEIWIRQGVRERRTRNEGRVRALMQMREEKKQRRQREGNASMTLAEAQRSGKLVIEAEELSYSYGDVPCIRNFSTLIARGDKIGIIGPNGCGKTTLVKLLLGELPTQTGSIRLGTNLSVTYFDQMRGQLDEEKSVWENVLPSGDFVNINGQNRHIITYLQDFLFTPDRAKSPVSHLSGGERNRLLLARLFTNASNFLVLDEPTNDLDAETLELLEELLMNFKGTILLICHDRAFLNNVVTSTLVFSGNGKIEEYVGGYDDWLAQRPQETPPPKPAEKNDKKKLLKEARKATQKRKLSFSEKRELDAIPAKIEALETEQETLSAKMADPDFYRNADDVKQVNQRLAEIQDELLHAYERWEQLEEIEANA